MSFPWRVHVYSVVEQRDGLAVVPIVFADLENPRSELQGLLFDTTSALYTFVDLPVIFLHPEYPLSQWIDALVVVVTGDEEERVVASLWIKTPLFNAMPVSYAFMSLSIVFPHPKYPLSRPKINGCVMDSCSETRDVSVICV